MKNNTYHVFFTNLANPLRIKIISSLREKAKNVSELTSELREEQSKVSHALMSLRHCNIVDVRQKGKERIYSLNKKTILPILKVIDNHAQVFCGGKCDLCGK